MKSIFELIADLGKDPDDALQEVLLFHFYSGIPVLFKLFIKPYFALITLCKCHHPRGDLEGPEPIVKSFKADDGFLEEI